MSKVRIINDKTGAVQFVSEFVAKQTKQLKAYGFRVQNLEQKKEYELPENPIEEAIKEIITEVSTDESVGNEITFEDAEGNPVIFDDLVEEQPTKVKGKPGRKPQITETE